MTKAQEIKILKDAAVTLGEDSYCGKWLASQIQGIEHNIQSDMFPQVSYKDCVNQCHDMKDLARREAKDIENAAKDEAARIRGQAQIQADNILARARRALREALELIND